MHPPRNRISMISVDELEKGTGSLTKKSNEYSEPYKYKKRGSFTAMDWIQFFILLLIFLVLTTILIIIIIIIVKLQQFTKSADNLFSSSSPLGSLLRKLLSS